MSLKSDTEGDHELMNRPTQSLYKDRLPPLPDLPILKLLTHTALASKSKKHNLKRYLAQSLFNADRSL